ncbi:hypothetical protein [Terasakiella pusilla]|uniref:hypothetical protein n=1 Tax=Terasakiella pusilla TaxID=64973 RepID=UPI00048A9FF6|nr:hypothetical protein [Terasakiella pusilla]
MRNERVIGAFQASDRWIGVVESQKVVIYKTYGGPLYSNGNAVYFGHDEEGTRYDLKPKGTDLEEFEIVSTGEIITRIPV